MSSVMRRPIAIAAVIFAVLSAGDLVLMASHRAIPSAFLGPLSWFVKPGVLAWCLAFGTLFSYTPESLPAIAAAAIANTVFWVLAFWLARALARAAGRLLHQAHSE